MSVVPKELLDMSKPMIGVTVSEIRAKEDAQRVRHGEPTQTEMTLGLAYMRAVERAGGLPVALPPLESENVDPLLDQLSGLLLTGGPDLDPACYGAGPHPELGPIDHDVDVFEIALCRRADRRGMPILGICRGTQVLNVARQGSLIQHLPDVVSGAIDRMGQPSGNGEWHRWRANVFMPCEPQVRDEAPFTCWHGVAEFGHR